MGGWEELRCATGFHFWTVWSYKSSSSCEQESWCSRCGKIGSRTNHQFSGWHNNTRTCGRCGEEQIDTTYLPG
jgi:hypothetical protein